MEFFITKWEGTMLVLHGVSRWAEWLELFTHRSVWRAEQVTMQKIIWDHTNCRTRMPPPAPRQPHPQPARTNCTPLTSYKACTYTVSPFNSQAPIPSPSYFPLFTHFYTHFPTLLFSHYHYPPFHFLFFFGMSCTYYLHSQSLHWPILSFTPPCSKNTIPPFHLPTRAQHIFTPLTSQLVNPCIYIIVNLVCCHCHAQLSFFHVLRLPTSNCHFQYNSHQFNPCMCHPHIATLYSPSHSNHVSVPKPPSPPYRSCAISHQQAPAVFSQFEHPSGKLMAHTLLHDGMAVGGWRWIARRMKKVPWGGYENEVAIYHIIQPSYRDPSCFRLAFFKRIEYHASGGGFPHNSECNRCSKRGHGEQLSHTCLGWMYSWVGAIMSDSGFISSLPACASLHSSCIAFKATGDYPGCVPWGEGEFCHLERGVGESWG